MVESGGTVAWVRALDAVGSDDVAEVGGKNAFVEHNGLDETISEWTSALHDERASLAEAGGAIRAAFEEGEFPEELAAAIRHAYRDLAARCGRETLDVAVRSSATAEDLPEASFAGQQETFLNVVGEQALLVTSRRCYASLFTDRAISYREEKRFDHHEVALSVGVQEMVRSDLAGAGVLFTIDPETGFEDVVVIDASWGLGETVVQGSVDPDEYTVFKPLLGDPAVVPILDQRRGGKAHKIVYAEKAENAEKTEKGEGTEADAEVETVETSEEERLAHVLDDEEIVRLAQWGARIEAHYGRPMDVEWAKDGRSGELFIVQARPETVQSQRKAGSLRRYTIRDPGEELVSGLAIGEAIGTGPVCVIHDAADIDRFVDDAVLVTGMTDPDWVPIMKRAAAIVTDHGGRTSHAAIVSRELGLPAVVGTGEATNVLEDGQAVTVSCAEGEEGRVYADTAEFEVEDVSLEEIPPTQTQVMINLASPGAAFRWARLPADGVGLARMEFVINNAIKIHPMALVRFDEVEDEEARERIEALTRGWADKRDYFVDRLAYGVARIVACQYPRPVLVRTSDFKTNEYAELVGGAAFEHEEANPMLGFRGAVRYSSERYREAFALECRALRKVREDMGLSNLVVMIPFCRTPEEADRVLHVLAENGLVRGRGGLSVYAMCEVPSNVFLAEEFAERFDGFSIGSNDLTQLVLGVDRDSEELAPLFDERHRAVTGAIRDFIARVHARRGVVGFCGQAPSDDPGFARFLVEAGVDSVSVSPDGFMAARREVAAAEAARATEGGRRSGRS